MEERYYSNPKSFVKNQKIDQNPETLTSVAFFSDIFSQPT